MNLLVVTNTASADGAAVRDYYRAHRPGAAGFDYLDLTCATTESTTAALANTQIIGPILDWVEKHAERQICYVLLVRGIPTRTSDSGGASVDFRLWNASGSFLRVTRLDMGSAAATLAYVDNLDPAVTTGPVVVTRRAPLVASAFTTAASAHWTLDDAGRIYPDATPGDAARGGLLDAGVDPNSIDYTSGARHPEALPDGMAGYLTWGTNGGLPSTFPSDESVFAIGPGRSSYHYVMMTVEPYNGMLHLSQPSAQSNVLDWFAEGAWGTGLGSYVAQPVGAVAHTGVMVQEEEQPISFVNDPALYFGLWVTGHCFADCAWASRRTANFIAVGDPWVALGPNPQAPTLLGQTSSPMPANYYQPINFEKLTGEHFFRRAGTTVLIDLGNCTSHTFDPGASTEKAHRARKGVVSVGDYATASVEPTLEITVNEAFRGNVDLILMGQRLADVGQAAATAVVMTVNAVALLGTYDLGKSGLIAPVVKKGTTTLVAGVDYDLDAEKGYLKVRSGGALVAGDNVTVTADVPALTFDAHTAFDQPDKRGDIIVFEEDTVSKMWRNRWTIPVTLMPSKLGGRDGKKYSEHTLKAGLTGTPTVLRRQDA